MFSKAKVGIALGALAAVLSAGTINGVYAATNDQATSVQAANKADQHKIVIKGFKGGEGKGFFLKGKGLDQNEDLLKLLNLSADELKEALKADKSLADVAKEQGVSVEDVVKLIAEQEEAQLTEAVKAGKLTQEQADKMKENAAERIQKMVESTRQDRGFGPHGGFVFFKSEELLKLLDLTAEELDTKLKAGKSLADVAKTQGVSVEDVVSLIAKHQEEQLAEAVKAGKLTQEQADKMSENASERIQKMVESTHQDKGFGPRGFGFIKSEELLKLLNLTAEELETELKAGKSLAEVAEAQGVDTDEVVALLAKQRADQLSEAVKAGKITQEQADKLQSNLTESIQKQLEHKRGEKPEKVVLEN
ncbi:hypothetical protein [Brevibacillus borstelensis]|jgi:polyhydroxyalkanoate synthesis regulator phasin|uniref:hypothetical protein n=1 Tax=Brevibacillus borstelensis TaxID=45462 RepID=UPI001FA9BF60|nr:hypothetical protein [Brevibacillus borstelensis]